MTAVDKNFGSTAAKLIMHAYCDRVPAISKRISLILVADLGSPYVTFLGMAGITVR
jgi:hypothetical protein